MNEKKATRKDVAELAGVSETIVSYVLNNNRYVKREKKESVLAAMNELNYRPNQFARALKGKRSKHIVMMVDRIRTEYFGELVSDIEHFSGEEGYLVSVMTVADTKDQIEQLIERQIDGVIIASIHFPEKGIKKLLDAGIPVILFKNREFENTYGAFLINTGLYRAARKCVRYLLDVGCKNIVYIDRISANGYFSNASDHRYKGYWDEMEESGLAPQIISGCTSVEELQKTIVKVAKEKSVDGIYCRNDEIAFVAMSTLQRAGYRIPEDVSVIGLDNTAYSRVSNPTLTTLCAPREEIAKATVKLIEEYAGKECQTKELFFEPELIIRESVKKKEGGE